MTPQIRLDNSRPIKLRRLLQFNNTTSLGLVLPKTFVDKMELRAGNYMAIEMDAEGNSLSLSRCSVSMPSLTSTGEGDD